MNAVQMLYRSIEERWRPDDVAHLLLEEPLVVAWNAAERVALAVAARGRYRNSAYWERYGARGFATHSIELNVVKSYPLFEGIRPLQGPVKTQVESAVAVLRNDLKCPGPLGLSFRYDRLFRAGRKLAGLELSRRQYNKRFRILRALLQKGVRLDERGTMCRLLRFAKSGLAAAVGEQAFCAVPEAAAFMAYYVARQNRPSIFTNKRQSRRTASR